MFVLFNDVMLVKISHTLKLMRESIGPSGIIRHHINDRADMT